jgi:hypothetical protein
MHIDGVTRTAILDGVRDAKWRKDVLDDRMSGVRSVETCEEA